jgi:hypothetical protein
MVRLSNCCSHLHLCVTSRVLIVVIHTEQERVLGFKWKPHPDGADGWERSEREARGLDVHSRSYACESAGKGMQLSCARDHLVLVQVHTDLLTDFTASVIVGLLLTDEKAKLRRECLLAPANPRGRRPRLQARRHCCNQHAHP